MKLNFTKEGVLRDSGALILITEQNVSMCKIDTDSMAKYISDWLTLHAEVEKQTTLIEQLEKALKGLSGLAISHGIDADYFSALSAVSTWRKERE